MDSVSIDIIVSMLTESFTSQTKANLASSMPFRTDKLLPLLQTLRTELDKRILSLEARFQDKDAASRLGDCIGDDCVRIAPSL